MREALKTFKPKKSSGPDKIPLLIIKTCYDVLEHVILKLFNLIVTSGTIPDTWRLAKKGDRFKIENYRLISNLNSISKLFERCLLNRLNDATDGPNQHGFKNGHSTMTAALDWLN